MKSTTKKTTRIKEKVVEYFSLRDNWVEIKRENVMVGQEYNFNKLTSEEVNSMGLRWGSDLSCQRTSVTFYNVWRRPLLGENQQAVWLA